MNLFKPFAALTANKTIYKDIIAPPYDVLSRHQAHAISKDNAHSILHVTRADADFKSDVLFDSSACYDKASQALNEMIQRGDYQSSDAPGYFIYRIEGQGIRQTGVAGLLSLNQATQSKLKRHEHTKPRKVTDRAHLLSTLKAQISPVLLAIKTNDELSTLFDTFCQAATPDYQVLDAGGFCHSLWHLSQEKSQMLETFLNLIDTYYIADGHHRCEAARQAQQGFDEQTILSVVFPQQELNLLAYHRVIKHDVSEQQIMTHLNQYFDITPQQEPHLPTKKGHFGFYMNHQWLELNAKNPRALDIDTLHQQIIEPLFDITNPREDERIDFIGGADALNDLEHAVNSKAFNSAFTLYPTKMDEIIHVADDNCVMPPKSTWFEPKLLDGFFIQPMSTHPGY